MYPRTSYLRVLESLLNRVLGHIGLEESIFGLGLAFGLISLEAEERESGLGGLVATAMRDWCAEMEAKR